MKSLCRKALFASLSFITICLIVICPAQAATFCVSDAAGLQTALTQAASNGEDDIIRIVQRTYVGNFVYDSDEANAITIEGGYTSGCASQTMDPANTVLDGNGSSNVLKITSGEATPARVELLTFQNSNGGAGLYIWAQDGGSLKVDGCVFRENLGDTFGGGVWAACTTITLTNNTFTENSAYEGGGVWAFVCYGTITLTNNTFTENLADGGDGGGVHLGASESTATLTSNSFTRNSASYGGGVYVESGNVKLANNAFVENSAFGGAGVYSDAAYYDVTLTGNSFTGNSASYGGGGVSAHTRQHGTLTSTNNTFSGNSAYYGGGVHATAYRSTHTLTNNSFYANQATNRGGGIHERLDYEESTGTIYNNVLMMNTAPEGADLWIDNDGDGDLFGSTLELFNNDLDQSTGGTHIEIPFDIDPSNLDNVDPLFEDPTGGDYHLAASSPCIDKGSNDARSLPETDKDGNIRIINAMVDIGAYEYNSMAPSAPSVYTDSVTDKTPISATLNGRVNPNGLNTETYFEYGTTASYGSVTPSEVIEAASSFISTNSLIENLAPEPTYHYRIVATNSAGTSFGADGSFRTAIVYVSPEGTCYGNNPCFAVVQEAIDIAPSGATFKIQEGSYYEHILVDQAKEIILEPGCDSTFTTCSGWSGLSSLTLRNGETIIEGGCLKIEAGTPSKQ